MDEGKDRKQMIAFSSMIPGIALILIGIIIVFISILIRDDPGYNDPNDHAFLTPEDTYGNNSINITLESDYYFIWIPNGSDPGSIRVLENGTEIEEFMGLEDKDDYSRTINGTRYHFLRWFQIEDGPLNITIEKTRDGGFYLTDGLRDPVDFTLEWIGMGFAGCGIFLVMPGLISMLYIDRDNARFLREERKRERKRLSEVKFNIGNPKQVAGAIMFFILGPSLIAFMFYLILAYTPFISSLVMYGMVFLIVGIIMFGYQMFYDKKILGPGGTLSFRSEIKDNMVLFSGKKMELISFYQCPYCNEYSNMHPTEKKEHFECQTCGIELFEKNGAPLKGNWKKIQCPKCMAMICTSMDNHEIPCPNCKVTLVIPSARK